MDTEIIKEMTKYLFCFLKFIIRELSFSLTIVPKSLKILFSELILSSSVISFIWFSLKFLSYLSRYNITRSESDDYFPLFKISNNSIVGFELKP